ncbi:MAG TPA: chromate resistance protein ChrB domain-containing protein [Gemmatimonadaceae bacterium]|nr:chromate resistance protein ChrB domain-containing protein [Gemmatimonadaceae bacterium]
MKWVTRARPKVDRVACPWLIARFIDSHPEFFFVAPDEVMSAATALAAIPYDVPGVELSHVGPLCTFDAFLEKYQLTDPALYEIAGIVRGADTARLDLAPQCAGLLAISLGLSVNFTDDHEQVRHGMVMYDALYSWCRHARDEQHTWNPQRAG